MDKIKRIVLCAIPTSICNFRCRYCYLTHREEYYQGKQADIKYPPEYIAQAFSKDRMGGICYFNFCADGETLLTKDIDKYIYEIVKLGHYAEIVSNMTITPVLNKIFSWDKELLERVTFKCSFHYLQLLERNLLEVYAQNVNRAWACGCSANIEITPDDELIPYIEDVKAFSMEHFGALPQLSIARDDKTGHDYLTSMTLDEYKKTWEQFDSDFWKFEMTIFNEKRGEYCYAGAWSLFVNFASGDTAQCYCGRYSQNIYDDISKPINFIPIGKCQDTHCYNGHMLLTLGCIPGFTDVCYGDIRNRIRSDGTQWIQPRMKAFLNSKCEQSNPVFSNKDKFMNEFRIFIEKCKKHIHQTK